MKAYYEIVVIHQTVKIHCIVICNILSLPGILSLWCRAEKVILESSLLWRRKACPDKPLNARAIGSNEGFVFIHCDVYWWMEKLEYEKNAKKVSPIVTKIKPTNFSSSFPLPFFLFCKKAESYWVKKLLQANKSCVIFIWWLNKRKQFDQFLRRREKKRRKKVPRAWTWNEKVMKQHLSSLASVMQTM